MSKRKETLKTVLLITKVFKILALIATVLCFVSAAICIAAGSLVMTLPNYLDANMLDMIMDTADLAYADFGDISLIVLAAAVVSAGQGITFLFATKYAKHILSAGTPFTHEGARKLSILGIIALCVPLGTTLIASIMTIGVSIPTDFSSVVEYGIAVGMILISRFVEYGADLEDEIKAREQVAETVAE